MPVYVLVNLMSFKNSIRNDIQNKPKLFREHYFGHFEYLKINPKDGNIVDITNMIFFYSFRFTIEKRLFLHAIQYHIDDYRHCVKIIRNICYEIPSALR